jgi:small-conductance mechanosensitive channel
VEIYLQHIEKIGRFLPDWAVSLIIFTLVIGFSWVVHRLIFNMFTRIVADKDLLWRSMVSRNKKPTRLAVLVLGASFASRMAPLTIAQDNAIRHIMLICLIILIAWVARSALHIWSTVHLRGFKLDAADNLMARKHVTQFRILKRVCEWLIIVVAVSAALMTFDEVRQYGVSLLASAGAAGIVVGLALQPVLKNLLAGVQLAMTQPIRIDDALLVEGEWGNVEEITSTYVVVKLWDWRRLILPLNYFMEKPFQNWTRESSSLIGTVMIYLDYRAPVDIIRAKIVELAAQSPLHDGKVVNVAVTDFKQNTMEVRILVSAGDAGRTFDLRCYIREELVAFLRDEHPSALPLLRMERQDDFHNSPDAVARLGNRSELDRQDG